MPNFKSKKLIFILSFVFVLAMSGSAFALTLNISDSVDVELGSQVIHIEGTLPSAYEGNPFFSETAHIPFMVQFHQDAGGNVPDGDIREVVVKFTYDPEFLTLVDATPAECWGELTETTDYTLIHDDVNGIIYFKIEPETPPDLPVSSGQMTLAYFDFTAPCQPLSNTTDLIFSTIGSMTESSVDVEFADNTTNSYMPIVDYATNGSVTTLAYWNYFRFMGGTYRGALGTVITVPVAGWSNGMIDGLACSFEYDSEKLRFVGIDDYTDYFPAGFSTDPDYTPPAPGDNPVYLDLRTGDSFDADMSANYPPGPVIFNVLFEVLGVWDGQSTTVNFIPFTQDPNCYLRMGQDGEGFCEDLSQSLFTAPSGYGLGFGPGTITIDAYAAGFESRMLDGTNLIWNTAGDDQDIDFRIAMCNNFEAGTYTVDYDKAITAIIDPPDIFNFNFDVLSPVPGVGVDFDWDYSSASHDTISIYSNYNSTFDNIMALSECGVEGNVDIVNLTFQLDDEDVTAYAGNEYTLGFAPSTSTFTGETQVEASYSDKTVTIGNGLTTTSVPFNIASGEFSCDLESSTTFTVYQQYYLKSNFSVASFRVKVTVTPTYHYIQEVYPAFGVDVIEQTATYAIFQSNSDWVPTVYGSRVQFAEILYDNDIPVVEKVNPGTDCYYRYYYSAIEMSDAFMSDLVNDDPFDPQGNLPYLFINDNSIRKRILVCPEDRDEDIADNIDYKRLSDVIPTEFDLFQNYPNPFNPSTNIVFDLPKPSRVTIDIYNILGQHVKTLLDETRPTGRYEVTWNSTDDNGQKVSSGIYLYVMRAGEFSRSTKMILMK